MKKTNDVLSKGEAARRLQRSPATISAYLAAGMPCRSDGRLSWKTTQAWVKRNVASERSGRFAHDQRKRAGQAEGPGETLTELQREKLRIENQNRALDLAHRRGKLAPIEILRLEFGRVVVELWNRLLL